MNIKWNEKEKQMVRELAPEKTDQQLAALLTEMSGRRVTLAAVRKMRQRLGIKKVAGRGRCAVAVASQQ